MKIVRVVLAIVSALVCLVLTSALGGVFLAARNLKGALGASVPSWGLTVALIVAGIITVTAIGATGGYRVPDLFKPKEVKNGE